ncbi:hypothetical protein [Bosea sp. (in: a-proteobacteria)]|uniref:hypothetical protein n=1 Tax=Bosea sp. (in: a-proteobacteria) TaxID=1871050 RepID=UPI003F6E9958
MSDHPARPTALGAGGRQRVAVRNRWPPVILILASGRVSPPFADMPSETIFLRKPYSEDTLLKAIAA